MRRLLKHLLRFQDRIQWYKTLGSSQINGVLIDVIKDVRDGCKIAREELAHIVLHRVKPIVSRYFHDPDDVESHTSWIVCKFLQKLDMFNVEKKPLPFINTLASNYCVDELRKLTRRRHREKVYAQHRTYTTKQDVTLDQHLRDIFKDDYNIINDALVHGKDVDTLAKKYSVSKNHINTKIRYGKKRIKEECSI